jgi:hypothetical protein
MGTTFQTLIALVLLIFVLSVIVQAAQEFIKALLDTKASAMKQTLEKFMGNHLSVAQVQVALAQRGLDITGLENVNKEDFRQLLDAIPFEQQQLEGVVASAQATTDRIKDNIAASYDAMRAAFQQLYTKQNKQWTTVLSLVIVAALNANLIVIYGQIASDQAAQQAIMGKAMVTGTDGSAGGDQATDLGAAYVQSRNQIDKALQDYPILMRTSQFRQDFAAHPINEIAGLLIMGLLVSLGAPFWNDILKGMMGLNNTLNTSARRTTL